MADTELTDLAKVLSIPDLADVAYLVDVSDTSEDGDGSSTQVVLNRLLGLLAPTPGGRLTLTTATPVTTADVTGAGTIYYAPFTNDLIRIWDGTRYIVIAFPETSLALTLTSGKPYDIWGYVSAGALALESLVWTNDTTRATGLTRTNGIWHKTGDQTRMLLGSIYASGTNTTEDSFAKRYLSNLYNAVPRPMKNPTETTDSRNYTTATFEQALANAANQLDYIDCLGDRRVEAFVQALLHNISGINVAAGIGVDSTTVNSALMYGSNSEPNASSIAQLHAVYRGYPGVGRHTIVWLEKSAATGTTTWYGDSGNAATFQAGIVGEILG